MNLKILSVHSLKQILSEEKKPLIIDLRSHEDYQADHIPGAIWHDWESVEEEIPSIIARYAQEQGTQMLKNFWIICYCDHGNISLLVARDLARLGYSVMSLNGGWASWQNTLEIE